MGYLGEHINWSGFKEAQASINAGQYPVVDAELDWTLAESQADEAHVSHWDKRDLAERSEFMKAVWQSEGGQNV